MPPASIDGGWLREAASTWLPVAADTAVKGAVVLVLVLVVTSLMRRRSAAARHLVWLGALASLAAMPVLSLVLPSWRVLPAWTNVAPIAAADTRPTERPADTVASDVRPVDEHSDEVHVGRAPVDPKTAPEARADTNHSTASEATAPAAPEVADTGQPRVGSESEDSRRVSSDSPTGDTAAIASLAGSANLTWQVWVLIVWAGGTVLALLPLLAGSLSLWRLRRTAERVTDGPLLAMLERTAIATGVDRPVLLLRSDRRTMPMQWGIVHPKLLLPAEADRWSAERLEIVLLHELGHIRRHDCLAHLLAQIACAAHWFNPLAWTALRHMLTERERACDDLTLLAGCRPSRYAEHLLQIASGLQSNVLSAYSSIAVARKSELEGRLLAILDTTARRRRLTRTAAALATLAAVALVLPVSMLHAVAPVSPLVRDTTADISPDTPSPSPGERPTPTIPPDPAQLLAVEPLLSLGVRVESDDRGNVFLLHAEKSPLADDHLECLAELPHLERLYLADTKTTDAGMVFLRQLPKLRRLSLHGISLTDAGLAHLGELTALEALDLNHTQVTDAGIVHLLGMKRLNYLNLSYNRGITDAALADLKQLPRLRELHLTHTSITNAGLEHFRDMRQLTIVKLAGTQITPGWLTHVQGSNIERLDDTISGDRVVLLRGLPNLRHVRLQDVTDDDLLYLADLEQLERLDLSDTTVTDAGLQHVARMKNLRSLVLVNTAITDQGLGLLRELSTLESLDVSGTAVTDAGLRQLTSLLALRWVVAVKTNVASSDVLPGVRVDLAD